MVLNTLNAQISGVGNVDPQIVFSWLSKNQATKFDARNNLMRNAFDSLGYYTYSQGITQSQVFNFFNNKYVVFLNVKTSY